MEEALRYIIAIYFITCLAVGAFNIGYWTISRLFKMFKKIKEKEIHELTGSIKSPLATPKVLRTTSESSFHRDIVSLRQYCINQTYMGKSAELRIKEAKKLYDYILNDESIITKSNNLK